MKFVVAVVIAGIGIGARAQGTAGRQFAFRDVAREVGLLPEAGGTRNHAAAWGDADGDGYPDLFLGTFHEGGSKPSQYFRNVGGHFKLDEQPALRLDSCASGAVFVDLTNNGRLDLYVNNNAHGPTGTKAATSNLFRNEGNGGFTDVTADSGAAINGFQGRTVAALDFDGDGLLDLIASDFYYSSKAALGVALFRNRGHYQFEEVAAKAGLPQGRATSGCAAADFNADGWPDLVLVGADGNNRVMLNDRHGHFTEAPAAGQVLSWKGTTQENPPTGVSVADVNGDGLPDVVIGNHFKQPWQTPAPVRLYLNRGPKDGAPTFEDVTAPAGLQPLAMKAPHVEFADYDNDGRPDLFVSIVKFRDGRPYPLIYKNLGPSAPGGVPRFREDAWGVNDFPTADDRAPRRSGAFFEKVLKEGKILYTAAAPTGDFDRDGRLDILMATWWTDTPPLLLKNETPGGHWIDVRLECEGNGVNRMGVGSRVRVSRAGDPAPLCEREIAVGYGWCSGQEAVAHLGLGDVKSVDVSIVLPHGKGTVQRKNVAVDQRITVKP